MISFDTIGYDYHRLRPDFSTILGGTDANGNSLSPFQLPCELCSSFFIAIFSFSSFDLHPWTRRFCERSQPVSSFLLHLQGRHDIWESILLRGTTEESLW